MHFKITKFGQINTRWTVKTRSELALVFGKLLDAQKA
jgi:hypothetical protein